MALAPVVVAGQDERRVRVAGPAGDPIVQGTPAFIVIPTGFAPSELPLRLRLQVSLNGAFTSLFADTTLMGSGSTDVVIPRLLPQGISLWWRAVATGSDGTSYASPVSGPVRTANWVTLLTPNNANGQTVRTRLPQFVWQSPRTNPPVARWQYEIRITESATGAAVVVGRTDDSVYVPPRPLETNTSYRWQVKGWVPGLPDTARVASAASFVVLDPNAPGATVLYQNFPNPFPGATEAATCIWFDLRLPGRVDLAVLDVRGTLVRQLIPSSALAGELSAGRWGRPSDGATSGCDPRFTWDGSDQTGRPVPPGVYFVRLRADGTTQLRKALYKGR